MPAYPRNQVVREGEIATYHTWSRCVQQSYLCGIDPVTRANFDYRREWLSTLLEYLAGVFAIDIANFDILSNHLHLISRTRPDIANSWSDEEVAWRWKLAWPDYELGRWICMPTDEEIVELLHKPDKVAAARRNLASISWLMARWKEPFSRLANAESGKRGTCWESRFGCRELCACGADLVGNIYLDLNQIKAGMASSLEQCDHSGIQQRIRAWQRAQAEASVAAFHGKHERADIQLSIEQIEHLLEESWLAPISEHGPLTLIRDVGSEITGVPRADNVIITGPQPGRLLLPFSLIEQSAKPDEPGDTPRNDLDGHLLTEAVCDTTCEKTPVQDELSCAVNDSHSMAGGQTSDNSSDSPTIELSTSEPLSEIDRGTGPSAQAPSDDTLVERDKTAKTNDGNGQGKVSRLHNEQGEQLHSESQESSHGVRKRRRSKTGRDPTYDVHSYYSARQRRRASDNPVLSMSMGRYLALVEWTALELFAKRGAPMPPEMENELRAMGIVPERWLTTVAQFDELPTCAVGPPASLARHLNRTGKRTLHGINACRSAFT